MQRESPNRAGKLFTWTLSKHVSLLMQVASELILEGYIVYKQTEMEEVERTKKADKVQSSFTAG